MRSRRAWRACVGLHRVTLVALLAVVGGLVAAQRHRSVPLFLLLSLLALAGMATANVLLPSLVKLHFPDRVGLMTAVYSTALAIGLTSASVLTVPVARRTTAGGPACCVWALLAGDRGGAVDRPDRPRPRARGGRGPVGLLDVARTRLGWLMALFFGLQSMQAYADLRLVRRALPGRRVLGRTRRDCCSGVITGISIPLSFVVPGAGRPDREPGAR